MHERVLVGSRVALRPVTQGDYELIRMAETTGSDSLIYRHRGLTPSPEEFAMSLWRGVLTQGVMTEKASGAPAGVATSYGATPAPTGKSLTYDCRPGSSSPPPTMADTSTTPTLSPETST